MNSSKAMKRVLFCRAMIACTVVMSLLVLPFGLPDYASADGTPRVVRLEITPASWEGWAIYDIVEFKVTPVWSDGVPDPECTRAGAAPQWTTTYGWFEKEKADLDALTMAVPGSSISTDPDNKRYETLPGPAVIWSTGFASDLDPSGAGEGEVRVAYGGMSASARVRANEPNALLMPPGYIGPYAMLPECSSTLGMGFDIVNALFWGTWFLALQYRSDWYYNAQLEKVHKLSADLETYIRNWLAGKAPAKLPEHLLPPGMKSQNTYDQSWVLCRPEEVKPEEQWGIRPAKSEIDFDQLYFLAPEPNVTYMLLPGFFAPFGSRLVIEGDFPHCRFMDYQVSPPYDPRFPIFTGGMGNMEVPIVDADIEPDPGSVNPFRVGADRTAPNRRYHVYFNLEEGNPVQLNEALNPGSMTPGPIAYRSHGSINNTRIGGPYVDTGALGRGAIGPGFLWLRYYLPDEGVGPLGGVALPRCHLELSTGEKFWIKHDMRVVKRRCNFPIPAVSTPPCEPEPAWNSSLGWGKTFGGFQMFAEVLGREICYNPINFILSLSMGCEWGVKWRIRQLDSVLNGRGYNKQPPGNHEASFTLCTYNSFLGRLMSLGEDKVFVITGKLPKTPKTRDGQTVMEGGEARYFSIVRHGEAPDLAYNLGVMYAGVCDEDIVVDEDGWYIVAFSTAEDRPSNAHEGNGVTWVDWGPDLYGSFASVIIRWMSIMPEWHLPQYAPDENNLPWRTTAWSSTYYNPELIGKNKPGLMGDYHPVIHYMTKKQFEALGSDLDPKNIPYTTGW